MGGGVLSGSGVVVRTVVLEPGSGNSADRHLVHVADRRTHSLSVGRQIPMTLKARQAPYQLQM
jgi:hypothetical protein